MRRRCPPVPRRRATHTAQIIASRNGGTVQVIEELRELDVGELDGRRDEQAWACYRQVLSDWQAGRHEAAFPGGEDYQQMTARLASAFRHPAGSRVMFIGHGGIVRAVGPSPSQVAGIAPRMSGPPDPIPPGKQCGCSTLKWISGPLFAGFTLRRASD
jgi:broad specificity phosphatase PhoE